MGWSIENGNSYRCICGNCCYESDGEPCHVQCSDCNKLIDTNDCFNDYLCDECHARSIKTAFELVDEVSI